jgi:hypothetical protein
MLQISRVAFAAVVVCLVAGNVALAQGNRGRGGFGRGFRQSPATLIGNEAVQKELKLEGDQVAQANAIRDELFQGFRRGFDQNLSDEERAKLREEGQKKTEELNKKALALLNEKQASRIKQLEIWTNGVAVALTDNKDVVKELNLTDDQKGAMKTISEESDKKRGELFAGIRGASEEDRGKIFAQIGELNKETESECLAVLTDDQKAKFDKLRGEKFELPPFGGPGGGRRGRPGGNN